MRKKAVRKKGRKTGTRRWRFALKWMLILWAFGGGTALAGYYELGGTFSYSKTTYGQDSYSFTRRWDGNAAYHFNDVSAIEFTYENSYQRDLITGFQDTTFQDKVYTLSWVQALTPKSFFFQPFVKGGIGQMNQTAQGSYVGGLAPPASTDSLTVIVGAGLRLFLTDHFVIRVQATTYLVTGHYNDYKDNVATSLGLSIYF